MNTEIRHLLLDLECGRWADDPDGALKFLAQEYLDMGPISRLENEIDDLHDQVGSLTKELTEADVETERLKKKLEDIADILE